MSTSKQTLHTSPRWKSWVTAQNVVVGVVLLLALIFPFVVDRPRFWLPNIGVRTLWMGTIAMSLVFLNKYVGLLSLAQMTFAGICSYGIGYFSVTMGWPIIPSIILSLGVGSFAGYVTALIAVRTKAIYFMMITLALSQVFYSWASQAIEVTNARRGIAPIPRPDFGFINLNDITAFYYFALLLALLSYVIFRYTAQTQFGLAIQGIKDSPERMSALGYNVNRYRTAALTLAAFVASIGGVILVFDRNQVDPSFVSLDATLNILVVAVVGGIASLGGVFLGGLVFALLQNFAQDFTDRYMTLTGLVFIGVLLFFPAGLVGLGPKIRRLFSKRAKTSVADESSETLVVARRTGKNNKKGQHK
jgi:branched-chain amino acid transport system permease protein